MSGISSLFTRRLYLSGIKLSSGIGLYVGGRVWTTLEGLPPFASPPPSSRVTDRHHVHAGPRCVCVSAVVSEVASLNFTFPCQKELSSPLRSTHFMHWKIYRVRWTCVSWGIWIWHTGCQFWHVNLDTLFIWIGIKFLLLSFYFLLEFHFISIKDVKLTFRIVSASQCFSRVRETGWLSG